VNPPTERLSRGLVVLFAVATGVAVANLYYVQPLLDEIGADLGVSSAIAGLLVTATQLGYVLGLVFLVPVGDLVERRSLIWRLLAFSAVALVVCAAAPSFPVLAVALLATGALSCVAQVIVALSSHLADDGSRGRVVGSVMSGLLIGILSARTVSGALAELGGWRLVFALAAVTVLATAVLIRFAIRPVPATSSIGYGQALRSVGSLVRELPVLRQRMILGALHFAGFSVLWTSITFLLSGSPYDLGEGAIGLFGLAGIAGAAIAPVAGRLADRGLGRLAQTGFLTVILLSWGLLALGGSSVVPLLLGIVLIDLGVQGTQISNQAAVYALHGGARSRLTTAYMASVFLGGVCGSALASWVYGWGGWGPTCGLGAAIAAVALIFWGFSERSLAGSPILEAPLVQTSSEVPRNR
jgi:predicted MFS family arabinose efflux permease